jgi:hypothetical protein
MPVPITRAGVSLCYVAQSTTGDTDLALGFRLGAFSHASVSYNLKTLLYKYKLSQSGKQRTLLFLGAAIHLRSVVYLHAAASTRHSSTGARIPLDQGTTFFWENSKRLRGYGYHALMSFVLGCVPRCGLGPFVADHLLHLHKVDIFIVRACQDQSMLTG